jgi:hypothetical protein
MSVENKRNAKWGHLWLMCRNGIVGLLIYMYFFLVHIFYLGIALMTYVIQNVLIEFEANYHEAWYSTFVPEHFVYVIGDTGAMHVSHRTTWYYSTVLPVVAGYMSAHQPVQIQS